LTQIRHRYGIFACIGNHDQIDSRADFVTYTRRRLPLLINQRRRLNIDGERITIAGIDYAFSSRSGGGFPDRNRANVAATLTGHDPGLDGPLIAMAHHPHTWDALAAAGVPLTLSGHTHGGQLMLTPPGERPEVGIGRLLFRYTRGFYHAGGSSLFVNSGVGNWFPLRLHAPAEIVQIQFV
jgi:predicted MPP superfamily phosphohydrolase